MIDNERFAGNHGSAGGLTAPSYIFGLITGAALGGIGVTAAYVWFGLLRFMHG